MTDGITLGIIARNSADFIQRIHDKNHPEDVFDEIILTDTGSTDNTVELAKSFGWTVNTFAWDDDFSHARNANLDACKTRWYCWMDTDDLIEGIEKIPEIVAGLRGRAGVVVCPYIYERHPLTGAVMTFIARERIIDLSLTAWRWYDPVHENLRPLSLMPAEHVNDVAWVHYPDPKRESPTKRNVAILQRQITDGKATPETYYSLGVGQMSLNNYQEAIKAFARYLETGDREHFLYRSSEFTADCLRAQAEAEAKDGNTRNYAALVERSIDYDMAAMERIPEWADAPLGMAAGYTMLKQWQKALYWHARGLQGEMADPDCHRNPMDYTYLPYCYSHVARAALGDYNGALADVNKALSVVPSKELEKERDRYQGILTVRTAAVGACAMAMGLPDDKLVPFLDASPREIRADQDVRAAFGKRLAVIEYPGRPTIDFMCGQAVEEWSPLSLAEGGIGGSETAVIHVAQLLANKGARVRVLGNPGKGFGVHDGVEYYDWQTLPIDAKRNVLVLWRSPLMVDFEWAAKKVVFWAHDLNYGSLLMGKHPGLSVLAGVSKWHADYLKQSYPDIPTAVLRNGIDLSRYAYPCHKDPHTIIWSSSPDRGLDNLLQYMPYWKTIDPALTVHVYYGLGNIEKMAKTNAETRQWLDDFGVLLKENKEHFVWHGRVSQSELATAQMHATWWIFPTRWPEVSCITALEAQAAGLNIVSSDTAALPETINGGGVIVDSPPQNTIGRQRFVGEVAAWMQDPTLYDFREQQAKNVENQTWEAVVSQDWLPLLDGAI